MTYLTAGLLLVGSLLSAVAGLGILRFPDVYTRLHAASKAGPLGAGLILLGLGLASADWAVAIRCALGFCFLIDPNGTKH
jgi:multicomponent Na+:H+ antiporter subunit G